VPHLLRHGTSVGKVISERPVILTSEYRALDKRAITIYFKRLGFDAAGSSINLLSGLLRAHPMENVPSPKENVPWWMPIGGSGLGPG
jgi:hypothetical protein